jgi:hypothetical protein
MASVSYANIRPDTAIRRGVQSPIEALIQPKVIYGEDGRMDYYQIQDANLQHLADATVALTFKKSITIDGDVAHLKTENYGEANQLCETEPYYDQNSMAFCSGFLVGPDTVVTAGHCITGEGDCGDTRFDFDFKITEAGKNVDVVPADHIFSCAKVVHTVQRDAGADFAVVKLDRPVTHVAPLKLNRDREIQQGDSLNIIGYPEGLPMKLAGGANVRRVSNEFFEANLDSYAGNSGSAVFNATTGDVEGILVRGETDYVPNGTCQISNRCEDDNCRGEDVTRIDQVIPYLEAE